MGTCASSKVIKPKKPSTSTIATHDKGDKSDLWKIEDMAKIENDQTESKQVYQSQQINILRNVNSIHIKNEKPEQNNLDQSVNDSNSNIYPYDPKRFTCIQQQQAYKYIEDKAFSYSRNALKPLQRKINNILMGKQRQQYNQIEYNLKKYIRQKSSIIIHFNFEKDMPYFLKDTHYRNMFEVNRGRGNKDKEKRVKWENNLFDNNYKEVQANQRVKYAVLNYLNNPSGVYSANQYGESIMFLKNVKDKVTISDRDSANVGDKKDSLQLGTTKHVYHILQTLQTSCLEKLIKLSNGQMVENLSYSGNYKEVQVHGDIKFSDNVEKIHFYRTKRQKNDKNIEKMVQEFQHKFFVPIFIFDK